MKADESQLSSAVLTDSQDKALRRIAELREQCSLEQRAKAHLEESLRNDLEERDHTIGALKTKIQLLQPNKNNDEEESTLIPLNHSENDSNSEQNQTNIQNNEIETLKDKIKHYENLLLKSKDSITSKNELIKKMKQDSDSDKIKLKELENNISELKKKEEDAMISLAENKMQIHKELDSKESQIKGLEKKIVDLNEELLDSKNIAELNKQKTHMLIEEVEELKSKFQTIEVVLSEKENLLNEFEETVKLSNAELVTLKTEIETANKKVKPEKPSDEDIEALKLERDRLTSELNEKNIRLKSFGEELAVSKSNLQDAEAKLQTKSTDLENLHVDFKQAKLELRNVSNAKLAWTVSENELKAAKIILEENVKSTRSELAAATKKLAASEKRIVDLEKELKNALELGAKKSKVVDDSIAELNLKLLNSMNECEEYKLKNIRLEKQLRTIENQLDGEISASVDHEKNSSNDDETTVEEVESKLEKIFAKKRALEKGMEEKSQFQLSLASTRSELEEKQTQFEELLEELDKIKAENKLLHDANKTAAESESLTVEVEKLSMENDRLKVELAEKSHFEETISLLKSELDNEKEQLERSSNELEKLKNDNVDLRNKCANLSTELESKVDASQLQLEILNREKLHDEIVSKLNSDLSDSARKLDSLIDVNGKMLNEFHVFVGEMVYILMKLQNEEISSEIVADRLNSVSVPLESAKSIEEFHGFMNEVEEIFVKMRKDKSRLLREIQNHITVQRNNSNSANTDLQLLKEKSLELSNEFKLFKGGVVRDFNDLVRLCCDVKLKLENGLVEKVSKDIENNLVSKTQSQLNDIRMECDIFEKEVIKLKEQNSILTNEINRIHQDYGDKIEQIVSDYENKLKIRRENEQNDEQKSNDVSIFKDKLAEFEQLVKSQQELIERLNIEKEDVQNSHTKALLDSDKRWRSCLDKKIQDMETKHKFEMEEFTRKLEDTEEKSDDQVMNEDDVKLFKEKIQILSNELNSYKISKNYNTNGETSLEDFTEMEYLRNILYKYMMGQQPVTLAKVLAAIVKFDQDQTKEVIHNEEQKLSLLRPLRRS